MKIVELFTEQMVQPTPTTPATGIPPTPTTQQATQTPNPDVQKLAATLKNAKVIQNDNDVNDFMSAYQAQTTGKTLNPDQQEKLAALAPALMKDKSLASVLDLQLKTMSQQKPGQTTPPASSI
jgi:hypothetical protein